MGENLREDRERDEQNRVADDRSYRSERGAREQRQAVGPACEVGNPRACLTAAVFDERHDVPRAQVVREYAVACSADLAFGCFGVARLSHDPVSARDGYVRSCQLGEQDACEAGATLMPERATEFHEAACHLRSYESCERAAFAYLNGAGVRVDRERATKLAIRGCEHKDPAACLLRDEIAAGFR